MQHYFTFWKFLFCFKNRHLSVIRYKQYAWIHVFLGIFVRAGKDFSDITDQYIEQNISKNMYSITPKFSLDTKDASPDRGQLILVYTLPCFFAEVEDMVKQYNKSSYKIQPRDISKISG